MYLLHYFFCAIYWIVKYILSVFYPDAYNSDPGLCTFQEYIQTVVICQVVYALGLVSIRRLCIIIYPQRRLLKTNKWSFICIGVQWIFGMIISMPTFFISVDVRKGLFFIIKKIYIFFFSSLGM